VRAIIRRTVGRGDQIDDVTLVVVQATMSLGEVLDVELVGEPAALAAFRQGLRRWLDERGAEADEVQDIVMASTRRARTRSSTRTAWPPSPSTSS
jgi:hypothetical protein